MKNKITLKNSVKIIDNNYVIKKKKEGIENVYNYLLSRTFEYFPKIINIDNDNITYEYIDDILEPIDQKMNDLIQLVALLHNKTTFYKEVDIDYYKNIYEYYNSLIIETTNYYYNLIENINSEIYMSPPNYLVARNISVIFTTINRSKNILDIWYDLIKDKRRIRVCLNHNNLRIEHYLKNNKQYLISFDNAKIDIPIFDIINLYKNHYLDFNFCDIMKLYQDKYPLLEEEVYLFLAIILIPNKIELDNSIYKMVLKVRRIIDYIYKSKELEYELMKKYDTS